MVIIILVAARRGRPILGFAQRGTHGPALAFAPAMPTANSIHMFFSPGILGSPAASLGLPWAGVAHLQPIQALTRAPPVLALRMPFLAPASPPHHPSPPTPIPGEGLHPWETQACAFSSSWFSREPWLEGDGRRSPGGRGSGGSRTGTGRGRVWVGLDPACLPLSSCQSPPRPGWRTGGRGLAQENSVSQCLSEGGGRVKPQHPHPQLRPVVGVGPRLC